MCLQNKWIIHKHSSGGNLASLRHASAWRFLTGLRYLQERCFCPCARRTATGTVLIADIYQSCTIWFARSWCPKRSTNERERERERESVCVWARNLDRVIFFAGVPWAQQSFIAIHCQCFCRSAWAPCACRPQSVQWFAALTCKCCFILGNPPGCPSKKKYKNTGFKKFRVHAVHIIYSCNIYTHTYIYIYTFMMFHLFEHMVNMHRRVDYTYLFA